ncbi:hypothetical protein KP509_05G010500 [Ceratopteris richardii]|uniref:Uracil-DNA glycosylase n=1 Tax=Ceratopteris richardii TaxID=49495 RepID=A0A8T2URM8_CERRI|nr:hypothetical protein KP509_05G010500 [Ceratopteris richardii]
MAPSAECSIHVLRSSKRVCRSLKHSDSRNRTIISDCTAIYNSGHSKVDGKSDVLLQLSDGFQLKIKQKSDGKMANVEDLHFEEVKEYPFRHENDCDCESGKHGETNNGEIHSAVFKFPHSPVNVYRSTSNLDGLHTPMNENKYVDNSVASPEDRFSSRLHLSVSNAKDNSPKCSPLKIMKIKDPDGVPQTFSKCDRIGASELQLSHGLGKDGQIEEPQSQNSSSRFEVENTAIVGNGNFSQKPSQKDMKKTLSMGRCKPLDRHSASGVGSLVSDNVLDLNGNEKLSREESVLQTKWLNPNNRFINPDVDGLNFPGSLNLSQEQIMRMELNKAAAIARRNMRLCEEAVADTQEKRLPFPKFESLLVEKSWIEALQAEFQKTYMERIYQFVSQEAAARIPIYPPPAKLFNAFNSCPFDKVKVVVIGQSPYHGPGQAMGLCFSVEKGIKFPDSLTNIFLEIERDLGYDFPTHGNLEKWAYQGVLLMNSVLTVRDQHKNSHAKKGWELFTDAVIRALVQHRSGIIFLLWGNHAHEKLRLINKTCHHVLKAARPSDVSTNNHFFNCKYVP